MEIKFNDTQTIKFGKLLAAIGRLHASRADRAMERIGLFRGQAILLVQLAEQDGLTHTEVAERLQISPAAASKVIKRLEALNYLQRRPDPADERISRLFLLDDGRAVIERIRAAFRQVDADLLHGFSPQERQALTGLLLRVHANLLKQSSD